MSFSKGAHILILTTVVLVAALAVPMIHNHGLAYAQGAAVGSLPGDLFVKNPPSNPIGVRDARQNAKEGEPIVLWGVIGGTAKPFVNGRAVFLMADSRLPQCSCGCATPWDNCCAPKDLVMSSLATVQIPDAKGQPVKANLQGMNGLKPAAEVVVSGTVSRRTPNLLLVNAKNIYVKRRLKDFY
ncbi:hypothetical protein ACFL2Q_01115 [Thermodesulfobacteriota bacterium]